MCDKSTFVEFTGIAGVGKSTLFDEICKSLQKRDLQYDNLKLINVKKINLANIILLLKSLYLTFLISPKTFVGFKKTFRNIASHQIRCNSANDKVGLHISDEGIFHKIREFNRNSKEKSMTEIANKLFKYISIPDIVIVVEASADTIFYRRTKRNRANDVFEYKDIEKAVFKFGQTKEVIKFVKNSYKSTLNILEINNDDNKINIEYIVDILEKYCKGYY